MICLPQHYVSQDVLCENLDRTTTGSGEAVVHLHDLKAIRQLGGNSTSFPSAAEVSNTHDVRAGACKLMQSSSVSDHIPRVRNLTPA